MKIFSFALLLGFGLATGLVPAGAQSFVLEVPLKSQPATVAQRIGLTDITIRYSRPLVNGRSIWGALVPFGEVWRTGANTNTTFTVSDPVTINGRPLARGTYGLHTIPGANRWTLIFSRNSTSWGSFTYDSTEDALRVEVTPVAVPMHEALTVDFADLHSDAATVAIAWERLSIPFTVGVDVHSLVPESFRRQLRTSERYVWLSWYDAANYLLAEHIALDTALAYTAQSIAIEDRFENEMTRSKVLSALHREAEADVAEQRALALGSLAQRHQAARDMLAARRTEAAFALFRENAARFADQSLAHQGMARLYSAQGRFPDARREMSSAVALAAPADRPALAALLVRLENGQDINR